MSSCHDNVIKRFLWIHFVFYTIFGSNGKLFGILVVLNVPNYFVVVYPILKTAQGIPSTYIEKYSYNWYGVNENGKFLAMNSFLFDYEPLR